MRGHSSIDEAELKQARYALDVMLKHHEPYPTVVIDRNWNLLMSNEANLKIFGQFVDSITIWEDLALYFIESLEIELSLNPYNSQARQLLDEVRAYPDMPVTPGLPDTFRPYLKVDVVKDELALSFFTVISTFGTPQDVTLQELRIETFFAADETTEQFLRA